MYDFLCLFLEFIILSFIGYLGEVIYCSYAQKRLVNRGFLFGPICPIYGLGSILAVWSLSSFKENALIVFILGVLITSVLEYYTSYIFEKIFGNKWWDYSYRPDNINGRICVGNSLYFGLGIILVVYLLDPSLKGIIINIPNNILIIFTSIILILFVIDIIWSVIIAYNLRTRLIMAEELKSAKIKIIPKLFINKHNDALAKIKFKSNRLIKNYPNLASDLRKELDSVRKMVIDIKNVKRKKEKK